MNDKLIGKIRIAVFVSGSGTNLQALIEAQKNETIKSGVIDCVISSKRGVYATERAVNAGIDAYTVVKKDFIDQSSYEKKLDDILTEHGIGLIVLAGFLCVLSSTFTAKYEGRIINVHPSLIPSFCGDGFYGLHVHEAALARGVKLTGATVHYVNEITDGGRIIMQKSVRVYDNDTPEKLQKRVMKQAEWKILPLACEKVCNLLMSEKE
ncbi:MAG TPA: phosphoribosylglycinamide formyltransferase [Bacillota bacterium]|nr:phosphoribosylglycinamide formyltransferase [Bacillota bacterium]